MPPQSTSHPRNTTSEPNSWMKLTATVLNTARIINAFGWTPETVAEYIRPIQGKCGQGEALTAFRDLFDETGELPTSTSVMQRVGAKTNKEPTQGEDIYLYSAGGFCYGEGMLGTTTTRERVNGIPTGRLLNCNTFCGCSKCHHPHDVQLQEPEI